MYKRDKKKMFTNKFAKSAGSDFMMISYNYGMDLSDTIVKHGQEKVRNDMNEWAKLWTPKEILNELKALKEQQDK
jgi:hypothetical protein